MVRVQYCPRRISFVVNFCSLTSMARDALRVCHCCLLAEILWTSGYIPLYVSWKLRASEAEVVVIVVTYRAPTRTRVGQDCGWHDISASATGATTAHAVLQHDPRPQRLVHPFPSLPSPHRAQRPPPPFHAIHQCPNRLSHTTRHCALLNLYIQRHRLSLRTHASQCTYHMLVGILSQG